MEDPRLVWGREVVSDRPLMVWVVLGRVDHQASGLEALWDLFYSAETVAVFFVIFS